MGWFRQESAYDRRMHELEAEAERVRKNMQNLMKSLNDDQSGSKSSSARPSRSIHGTYSVSSQQRTPDQQTEHTGVPEARDDIGSGASTGFGSSTYGTSNRTAQPGYQRNSRTEKPAHLAQYLASGSFGKRGSMTRERKLQRDKAIFMLIFALIALFSLYTWLH